MAAPEQPELDVVLIRHVLDAQLPPEEPISQCLADPDDGLKLRAGNHALLPRACEYHVDRSTGVVEVRDYTDPRSMRSQWYDPKRPGQLYMAPSIEDHQVES